MKNQSAGILLYRFINGNPEVFLVHPGGPFHKNKNAGGWSVPKGMPEENEPLADAAKREFFEETGQPLRASGLLPLKPVKQKGGKIIFAWAAEGNLDPEKIVSNTCCIEYPYRSGKWIEIPEIDKAGWFSVKEAKEKINPAQVALIDELLKILKRTE